MTKSEARAIEEATNRALRKMQGVEMPWMRMDDPTREHVVKVLKDAVDEIERVRAMALAELER